MDPGSVSCTVCHRVSCLLHVGTFHRDWRKSYHRSWSSARLQFLAARTRSAVVRITRDVLVIGCNAFCGFVSKSPTGLAVTLCALCVFTRGVQGEREWRSSLPCGGSRLEGCLGAVVDAFVQCRSCRAPRCKLDTCSTMLFHCMVSKPHENAANYGVHRSNGRLPARYSRSVAGASPTSRSTVPLSCWAACSSSLAASTSCLNLSYSGRAIAARNLALKTSHVGDLSPTAATS